MKKIITLLALTFSLNVSYAQLVIDPCHIANVKYQIRATAAQPLPLIHPTLGFLGYEFGTSAYFFECGMHYDSIKGKISDICLWVSGLAGYTVEIVGSADSIKGKVYVAGPDSMPVGVEIASGQITSNELVPATSTSAATLTFIPLNSPANINSSFVLSITNPWFENFIDPDTFGIIGNKPNDPPLYTSGGNGLDEKRARFYDGVDWLRSKEIFGLDFNNDGFIMPVFETGVTPDFVATICAGQCVSFKDSSISTPTFWEWTFTGANTTTSSVQNPTNICYSSPGTYSVTLRVANSICSDTTSITKNILVTNNTYSTSFTISDSTLCPGNCADFTDNSTGSPDFWAWTFTGADVPSSTIQNPTSICYPNPGTFNVVLKSMNTSCKDSGTTTKSIVVDSCKVGIPTIKSKGLELKWVYPNPAKDKTLICYGLNKNSAVKITVFNSLSKIVFDSGLKTESAGEHKTQVDVSQLPAGKYYYMIQTGETQLISSFVVAR